MSTPAMIYLRHNFTTLLGLAVAASLLGASDDAHAADGPEGSGVAAPALPRDTFSRPIPQFSALPPAVASQLPGFERALGAYAEEMVDYNEGMLELSKNEYKRQRNGIVAFYNDGIDSRRVEERARRELAIADFTRFIGEYPSDATYTPDVLFRLGELYYEHAKDTYEQKNERYQAEMDRFERGFVADEPTPPEKEFNQAVATYERLIRDYPDYRLIDGALYLVGVLYAEAKDPRALATFERLTSPSPSPTSPKRHSSASAKSTLRPPTGRRPERPSKPRSPILPPVGQIRSSSNSAGRPTLPPTTITPSSPFRSSSTTISPPETPTAPRSKKKPSSTPQSHSRKKTGTVTATATPTSSCHA